MFPRPDLTATDEVIRGYFSDHAIEGLTDDELDDEAEHWEEQLDAEAKRKNAADRSPATRRRYRVLRWGGLGTAILGVPAAFAAPVIGVPIALAGLGVAVYGEVTGQKERRAKAKRNERLRLVKDRLRQLIRETRRRRRERGMED